MIADSLQWSTISARLRGNWFRNFLNVAVTAQFDPYERNESGQRVNQLTWNRAKKRRLVDFVSASLPITNRFTVKQIRGWLRGDKEEEIEPEEQRRQQQERKSIGELDAVEDFWSLFDNFSLNHNVTFNYSRIGEIGDKRDTFRITANSLRLRGDFCLLYTSPSPRDATLSRMPSSA